MTKFQNVVKEHNGWVNMIAYFSLCCLRNRDRKKKSGLDLKLKLKTAGNNVTTRFFCKGANYVKTFMHKNINVYGSVAAFSQELKMLLCAFTLKCCMTDPTEIETFNTTLLGNTLETYIHRKCRIHVLKQQIKNKQWKIYSSVYLHIQQGLAMNNVKYTLCTICTAVILQGPSGLISACTWNQHHMLVGGFLSQHGTDLEVELWWQGQQAPCRSMTAPDSRTAWSHRWRKICQDIWWLQSRRACSSNAAGGRPGGRRFSPDLCHPGSGHTCTPAWLREERG